MNTSTTPFQPVAISEALTELISVSQFLHQQGWTPATSSNFSTRNNEPKGSFFISRSGKDKGTLTQHDFMAVDAKGLPLAGVEGTPSAETLLHAWVYENFPEVNTVLHTHSLNGTLLSKLCEEFGEFTVSNLEILKGFAGITSHEASVTIPIIANHQDMTVIAEGLSRYQANVTNPLRGFLLAGHGLYTWGNTTAEARRHVEVMEFLMAYALQWYQSTGAWPE
ncbi:MAG: methylthioribulose 1-phosphate dehydratase [Vampirovibrionales bacterium]|nr:methylthioribulose 1-phosphate dehydratase [Vampirovibrionales bacterium]